MLIDYVNQLFQNSLSNDELYLSYMESLNECELLWKNKQLNESLILIYQICKKEMMKIFLDCNNNVDQNILINILNGFNQCDIKINFIINILNTWLIYNQRIIHQFEREINNIYIYILNEIYTLDNIFQVIFSFIDIERQNNYISNNISISLSIYKIIHLICLKIDTNDYKIRYIDKFINHSITYYKKISDDSNILLTFFDIYNNEIKLWDSYLLYDYIHLLPSIFSNIINKIFQSLLQNKKQSDMNLFFNNIYEKCNENFKNNILYHWKIVIYQYFHIHLYPINITNIMNNYIICNNLLHHGNNINTKFIDILKDEIRNNILIGSTKKLLINEINKTLLSNKNMNNNIESIVTNLSYVIDLLMNDKLIKQEIIYGIIKRITSNCFNYHIEQLYYQMIKKYIEKKVIIVQYESILQDILYSNETLLTLYKTKYPNNTLINTINNISISNLFNDLKSLYFVPIENLNNIFKQNDFLYELNLFEQVHINKWFLYSINYFEITINIIYVNGKSFNICGNILQIYILEYLLEHNNVTKSILIQSLPTIFEQCWNTNEINYYLNNLISITNPILCCIKDVYMYNTNFNSTENIIYVNQIRI